MTALAVTLVTMTHDDLPGVTKTVNILAYRYAYYDEGWRSSDDPDWTGEDPEVPQPSLGSLDVRVDTLESRTWWNRFVSVPVNGIDNAIDVDYAAGVASIRGTGGAGNERRLLTIPDLLMADAELYFEYDIVGHASGQGQTGLVFRRQGDVAVVVWQNILFGANASIIQGTWEYDGRTLAGTNQDAEHADLWGSEIVSAVGNGTTVTVTTATPHPSALAAGQGLTLVGVGSFTDVTVATVPTSTTFTFTDATVGSWTGGRWRWNLFAPNGRRKVRGRLVGNTITFHQWIAGQDEPSWGDSVRTITNTIPATLGTGKARPTGMGEVGLVVSHLGDGAQVNIYDFEITNLDSASPAAPAVINGRYPRSPGDDLDIAKRIDAVSPSDHGMLAWAFDMANVSGSTTATLNRINLVKILLRRRSTISTIFWWITSGAGATAGQNWVGLYDSTGARIAQTGVDGSISSGGKTTAITPVTVDPGFVWVALAFAASTQPGIARGPNQSGGSIALNLGLTQSTARYAQAGTGTTLPATITPASLTLTIDAFWAGVA